MTTPCISMICEDDGRFLLVPTCFSWTAATGLSPSGPSSARAELIKQQPAASPRPACVPIEPNICKEKEVVVKVGEGKSAVAFQEDPLRPSADTAHKCQSVDTYRAGTRKTTYRRQVMLSAQTCICATHKYRLVSI